MSMISWLRENLVYLTVTGSHAYGTHTEESDYDVRGAVVSPRHYYFGLERFEQVDGPEISDLVKPLIAREVAELDVVVWSLQKMVRLAAQGNPNMIELIHSPADCVLKTSPFIERILEIRETFVSRMLKHRFSGYAMQQLKRMRNHYHWNHHPPHHPTREEFGIESVKLPKDQIQAVEKLIQYEVDGWLVDQTHLPEDVRIQLEPQMELMIRVITGQLQIEATVGDLRDVLERAANRTLGFDSDFINFLSRYKQYRHALAEWQAYQIWSKNRNPKRAALEKKYGYDGKHGMHLVRLMRMAREILEGRGVVVRRPDAEELLAIRDRGAWKYDDLISWAEQEDEKLNEVMKTSGLPASPDTARISAVLTEVTGEFLHRP